MKESQFLTELGHSVRPFGAFFYKITDMPHFAGQRTKFDLPKPFDAIMVYRGKAIAIEGKIFKKYQAFGQRHLRPSQLVGLEEFTKAGGEAYVFLNMRIPAVKDVQRHVNRLYVFTWEELRDRDGSFPKKELVGRPYYQGRKGKFDLASWFVQRLITETQNPIRSAHGDEDKTASPEPRVKAHPESGS